MKDFKDVRDKIDIKNLTQVIENLNTVQKLWSNKKLIVD